MILMAIISFFVSFTLSTRASKYLIRHSRHFYRGKKAFAERVKLHKKAVPRLGGAAIYAAFFGTVFLFFLFKKSYFQNHEGRLLGIFLASSLVFACGLYDDIIKRLTYKIKFVAQLTAVLILVFTGYAIQVVTNPFNGSINLGVFAVPLLAIWLVVLMNALNLMDGLDGMAVGIAAITSAGLWIMAWWKRDFFSLFMISSFMGAALGFLRYNFYPAKLFLGDSGSLFLGLIVGIMAVESSAKRATAVSLTVPLLILLIPIGSVVFTFSRRIAGGKNPFEADRWHLHYRLLHAGISHRAVVLIFYAAAFLYSFLGTACFFTPKKYEFAVIAFAGVSIGWLYMWALYFIHKHHRLKRKRIR